MAARLEKWNLGDVVIGDRCRKDMGDIEALAASIECVGLLQPIVVRHDGRLIAGARRLVAVEKLGHRSIWAYTADGLFDAAQLLEAERDENTCRKDLAPSEIVALGKRIEGIEGPKAEERRTANLRRGTESPEPETCRDGECGETRDRVAQAVGRISGRTYEKAKQVVEAAEKDPETFTPLVEEMDRTGKVDGAHRKMQTTQRRRAAEAQGRKAKLPPSVQIFKGDFRQVIPIEIIPESVDLIFTDPPYDEKSIPLFGDLAQLAARVLKPGGSLITYCGHYALPEVLWAMSSHLEFWWIICSHEPGANKRFPGKFVFIHWKPLLWFVKETRRGRGLVADMVNVESIADKFDHDWQQGEAVPDYYIGKLTEPGDLVLDPMCGSGTTIAVAHRLGRRAVGIEIDSDVALRARAAVAGADAA